MPPGFYNPYDQQVYDAGFKYIPQSKYLLNPFTIPTDDSTTTPPDTGGITSLNRGGGGGGALQAGDINYDSFAKAGFDSYANRQPTPLVDDLYQSKLDKSFMGFPSYKEQQLTGPDMGEYIASGTDVPLELTGAGKVQNTLGNIGQGITGLANKIGGFGPVSMLLGSMDKFDTLPELDQQFIKQSMGYRGPTVFGENTGGGYVDPFGVNVRSAFGNYAEKVRDDFSGLEESLTGRLTDKYGAQFNPATGLFESDDDEEAAALANKNTAMMRKKYAFRKKQLEQQVFDEKIAAQQKAAEEAAARAAAKRERDFAAQGRSDPNDPSRQGASGRRPGSGGTVERRDSGPDRNTDSGGTTYDSGGRQGFGYGLADGGRVYYMDGGLADLVDIYD